MTTLACVLHLSAGYPLWRAWRDRRGTSLRYALGWTVLAWAGWAAVMLLAVLSPSPLELQPARLLALALTGCAGVAVLGARWPGAAAWNFVVLGLLAVLLLPLAEGLLAGTTAPDPIWAVFLAGTLAMAVLNYLPTRLAPAALLGGLGSGWELADVVGWHRSDAGVASGWLCLAGVPWLALVCWRWRRREGSDFDRVWRDFRDRYGLVWGQRLREQFNAAAANAGWPITLTWHGLRGAEPGPVHEAAQETLGSMLRRFGRP